MTKEEYLKKTGIKDAKEAEERLFHLRLLFVSVFVSFFILSSLSDILSENLLGALSLAYLGLLVFFVVYCLKVKKLTRNVTSADVVWTIIFAPISWLWFYPAITRPLKIITGKLGPPEEPVSKTPLSSPEGATNQFFWRTMKLLAYLIVLVLFAWIFWLSFDVDETVSERGTSTVQNQTVLDYHYVSVESGFEANFPEAPTRVSGVQPIEKGSTASYTTYQTKSRNTTHYVLVNNFSNPDIAEFSDSYDVEAGLEAFVEGTSDAIPNALVTHTTHTNFLGHKAIDFTIQASETEIEGIAFFAGVRLYVVAVEYPVVAVTKPSLKEFLSGITLTGAAQVKIDQRLSPAASDRYDQTIIASSVVNILCPSNVEGQDSSGGSGTLLTEDGIILTNSHIIPQDSKNIYVGERGCMVILPDPITGQPKDIYLARPMVFRDFSDQYDLAFMQIYSAYYDEDDQEYKGLFPREFPSIACEEEEMTLGESIRIFGYPSLSGGFSLTVTEGIVSSFPADGTIITSANISSGNSGGLAVNSEGCMIGVPTRVSYDETGSLGVIVPMKTIYKFTDEIDQAMKSAGE